MSGSLTASTSILSSSVSSPETSSLALFPSWRVRSRTMRGNFWKTWATGTIRTFITCCCSSLVRSPSWSVDSVSSRMRSSWTRSIRPTSSATPSRSTAGPCASSVFLSARSDSAIPSCAAAQRSSSVGSVRARQSDRSMRSRKSRSVSASVRSARRALSARRARASSSPSEERFTTRWSRRMRPMTSSPTRFTTLSSFSSVTRSVGSEPFGASATRRRLAVSVDAGALAAGGIAAGGGFAGVGGAGFTEAGLTGAGAGSVFGGAGAAPPCASATKRSMSGVTSASTGRFPARHGRT